MNKTWMELNAQDLYTNASESEPQWKEELVIPQEPAEPTPAKDWFTEFELDFFKQQLEKLIDSIPDEDPCCGCTHEKLKAQLRKDYLND